VSAAGRCGQSLDDLRAWPIIAQDDPFVLVRSVPWSGTRRRDEMEGSVTADEKRRLVASRTDWWHCIDFGDGIVSPGTCGAAYQQFLWNALQLPERMDGLRVLDIGTYDGFFAFESERRGAEVVAIDVNPEDFFCFGLAKRLLGSRVPFHQMSVYDLDEEKLGGPFDLVLCLGVYYHLRHLFIALDNLWKITRGEIRLETHVIDNHFVLRDGSVTTLKDIDARLVDVPIYRFYRFNDLNKADYSNWFGGNVAAVIESLSSAGFTPALLETWSSRAAFRAVKNPTTPREWEIGSYEGTRYTLNPDGTWRSHWLAPKDFSLPDRGR
jgi:tRNA (mo5U34)-methyltransferase